MDGKATFYQGLLDNTTIMNDNGATHMESNSSVNVSNCYVEDLPNLALHWWMQRVIVPILAVLGIIGNLFSLAVWQMETSFNVTVFLFKFLGVWDTVYLVTVIIYCYRRLTPWLDSALWHFGNYAQLVSVHATLLIAISRWIAVTFPFRAQRLLTSCRVYLMSVFVLMHCGALIGCQVIYGLRSFNIDYFFVEQSVGLILPLLLLVIFNISLLWTATRRQSILSQTDIKKTRPQAQRQSDRTNSEGAVYLNIEALKEHERCEETQGRECGEVQQMQIHRQQEHHLDRQDHVNKSDTSASDRVQHVNSQRSRKRPMVKAVLLVSLCSFISYPVGITLRTYLVVESNLCLLVKHILSYVVFVCHVVNSSINVLIYWFFVSKFRQLATTLRNHFGAGGQCCKAGENPR